MKKLIVLCLVAIMSLSVADKAEARFGIKGGVNVSSLDKGTGAMGYSAGLSWQIDLPLWLSLQPEVLYHVKATSLSEIEGQLGLGYIELPLNIQWGPRLADRNIRVFAQATPFIGYAIAQTGNTSSILDEYREELGLLGDLGVDISGVETLDKVNQWTNINRLSYGCGIGAGIQLWALQFTAQYVWNFGQLTDNVKFSKELFNDNNFGGFNLTVALMFGGR